jgi:hypothetical protein
MPLPPVLVVAEDMLRKVLDNEGRLVSIRSSKSVLPVHSLQSLDREVQTGCSMGREDGYQKVLHHSFYLYQRSYSSAFLQPCATSILDQLGLQHQPLHLIKANLIIYPIIELGCARPAITTARRGTARLGSKRRTCTSAASSAVDPGLSTRGKSARPSASWLTQASGIILPAFGSPGRSPLERLRSARRPLETVAGLHLFLVRPQFTLAGSACLFERVRSISACILNIWIIVPHECVYPFGCILLDRITQRLF